MLASLCSPLWMLARHARPPHCLLGLQDRKVTTQQGLDLAKEKGMLYIECRCVPTPAPTAASPCAAVSDLAGSPIYPLSFPSAKTSKGVQDAFEELSQKVRWSEDVARETMGPPDVPRRLARPHCCSCCCCCPARGPPGAALPRRFSTRPTCGCQTSPRRGSTSKTRLAATTPAAPADLSRGR